MKLDKYKEILSENKDSLFLRYSIKKLGVFGGADMENNKNDGYLSVFVEFKQPIGLRFVDLEEELEKILNIKVDLTSKNGIDIKYLKAIRQELEYV